MNGNSNLKYQRHYNWKVKIWRSRTPVTILRQNDVSDKICRIVISFVYSIVCKFHHDIRTIASRKQIPFRDFPQILLPASFWMHHDFKPLCGSQNSDTNHSIFVAILNTRQATFYGTFLESAVLFCFTFIPFLFFFYQSVMMLFCYNFVVFGNRASSRTVKLGYNLYSW